MNSEMRDTDAEPVDSELSVALVVDLDGTLCRTDTLHEAMLSLLTTDPLGLLRSVLSNSGGRAGFKASIADRCIVDPASLPMNESVIETIRVAREAGRRVALVSAADHRQVTAVAEAIGLFDEAYGTAEGQNLKGATKAAFLTEHFGAKKFDYMGDSKADVPVWHAARQAITVGASPGLRHAAQAANPHIGHIDLPTSALAVMLKAMRPHQWSKNLLLFAPMLASHDFSNLVLVLLGFIAFCLAASAIYLINDLIDLSNDRAHPRKRNRPFASGDLTAAHGVIMAGGLLLAALIFGLLTGNSAFIGVLALYVTVTFAYSLWLKRKLIVDVLTLAGLYTVRVLAGGAAASVALSPWLLGFSMFLFLGLAAVKRQAELVDQMDSGRSGVGRAYEVEDLPILRSMAMSAGNAAVLVLALYINSDAVQMLYPRSTLLWLICPILLYWSTRMVMKAHRGLMSDDPIVFAATDRVSLLLIVASASIALAASI